MGELYIFYGLASLIALSSIGVIRTNNPVTAIVSLVFCLFFLAGIYAMQGADFVAAIQVIIYAGAILVLFLFVIMLLNLDPKSLMASPKTFAKLMLGTGIIVGTGFFGFKLITQNPLSTPAATQGVTILADNTYEVGVRLFSQYLWPFELASILILLAIVSSIVIARKTNVKKKG